MITVYAMNTNDHAPQSEVDILERMVDRHLSLPHEFICITESDLPGWWGKIRLLSPELSRKRNLFLDTDVVITGSLDALVEPLSGSNQMRTIKNWAVSGHNGIQSSAMYWEGNSAQVIHDEFDPADAHWPPRTDLFWDNGQVQHGDQCFMTYLRDTGRLEVEYFNTAHVASYKYHLQKGLTPDCRVAVFHGRPNPDEVNDEWVKDARA